MEWVLLGAGACFRKTLKEPGNVECVTLKTANAMPILGRLNHDYQILAAWRLNEYLRTTQVHASRVRYQASTSTEVTANLNL